MISDETSLVDIHCHCLPSLDDGPADLEHSLDLCKALVEDGFGTIVATPHQMGRYEGINTRNRIISALKLLQTSLEDNAIPLDLYLGADVRIHDQLDSLVSSGDALSIDDAKKYLLLELPHDFFVDPIAVFDSLSRMGVKTVLTHPERYRYLHGDLNFIEAWQAKGAIIQITAGSLLGDFGRTAFEFGWRIVRSGLADVIATDAHDISRRPPRMQAAIARLEFEVGVTETNRLCRINPRRILQGKSILHWNNESE